MLRIQGTGRIKSLAGRKSDGSVENVEGIICPRKHTINRREQIKIKSAPRVLAFVSSPLIYNDDVIKDRAKGWCHAFRDTSRLPSGVPNILLPESDFIDPKMVYFSPQSKLYDYFYFTINATPGIKNKGLYTFIDILPTLCKHKLKGLVVVYFPNFPTSKKFKVKLSKQQKNILRASEPFLTYHWGLLGDKQMNNAMVSCRFGLFPNTVDNSPRIISESLVRDIPVMINDRIDGGWHYVQKDTGCLFNVSNLDESIDFMMSNDFHAKEIYQNTYGFEKSSKRLCDFIKGIFGYNQYTHMYFKDFKKYLKAIR